MSQELDDRRQCAREAFYDTPGFAADPEDSLTTAIEVATRVKITPEIIAAVHRPGTLTDEDALRAAFEAAGFEVLP